MVVAHHPDRSQVVVAKLNGHAHGELRSKLGVRAFPTFKWLVFSTCHTGGLAHPRR